MAKATREPKGLSYCAAQVRRLDPDRYLTAVLAPAAAREDLMALYALNAELARIRESISEPMIGHIRLQWWRDSVDGLYAGDARRHAVLAPLGAAIARHGLPQPLFHRLVDAREQDMESGPPPTMDAMLSYADGTSATLVALALAALGAKGGDQPAAAAGQAVGRAWALTGLLRAVPFHARGRRLYLPADLLDRHGVRARDVLELRPSPALAKAVAEVAALARERLAEARRAAVPRGLISPLLLATIADLHLRRLRAARYDVFDARVAAQPAGLLPRLMVRAWRGRF